MGNGIWHSGTLAAAKQATLFGIRGIVGTPAVRGIEPDFAALEPHVERVLDTLMADDTARPRQRQRAAVTEGHGLDPAGGPPP